MFGQKLNCILIDIHSPIFHQWSTYLIPEVHVTSIIVKCNVQMIEMIMQSISWLLNLMKKTVAIGLWRFLFVEYAQIMFLANISATLAAESAIWGQVCYSFNYIFDRLVSVIYKSHGISQDTTIFNKIIIFWKHKKPIFVPFDAHHELTVMGQNSAFFSQGKWSKTLPTMHRLGDHLGYRCRAQQTGLTMPLSHWGKSVCGISSLWTLAPRKHSAWYA